MLIVTSFLWGSDSSANILIITWSWWLTWNQNLAAFFFSSQNVYWLLSKGEKSHNESIFSQSYELYPINISRGKLSLSLHLSLSSPHQRTHLHQWRLGHTLYNSYKNNKLIKFKAQKNHKYNDVSAWVILLFTYTTTILAFSVFRRKQTKNDNFTLHLNNYPKWGIKLIPSCVINRKIQHGRSDRSNLLWF